jgi:G patch domain-containing protein 1
MGQYDFSIDVAPGSRKKEPPKHLQPLNALSTALEGFSLAAKRSSIKKHFEPPAVPRDWRPSRTPLVRKSRFEPAAAAEREPPSSAAAAATNTGNNPTRDQRRAALFPDEANRLASGSKPVAVAAAVAAVETPAQLPDFLLADMQTTTSKGAGGCDEAAVSAVGGAAAAFRPFAANAEKQTRYEQYLACLRNGRKDALKLLQPRTMTEWERERERVEFERAALLYQPLKAVIASRFVSAGSMEDEAAKSGTVPYYRYLLLQTSQDRGVLLLYNAWYTGGTVGSVKLIPAA